MPTLRQNAAFFVLFHKNTPWRTMDFARLSIFHAMRNSICQYTKNRKTSSISAKKGKNAEFGNINGVPPIYDEKNRK
jgi:hypothetical protein